MRTRHQKVLSTFEPKLSMAPSVLTVSHEGLPRIVPAAVGTSDLGEWVRARAEAGGIGSTHVRHLHQLAAKHQETKSVALFHETINYSKVAIGVLRVQSRTWSRGWPGWRPEEQDQGPFLGRRIHHAGSMAATSNGEPKFWRSMKRSDHVSGMIRADLVCRPAGAVLLSSHPLPKCW